MLPSNRFECQGLLFLMTWSQCTIVRAWNLQIYFLNTRPLTRERLFLWMSAKWYRNVSLSVQFRTSQMVKHRDSSEIKVITLDFSTHLIECLPLYHCWEMYAYFLTTNVIYLRVSFPVMGWHYFNLQQEGFSLYVQWRTSGPDEVYCTWVWQHITEWTGSTLQHLKPGRVQRTISWLEAETFSFPLIESRVSENLGSKLI